MNTNFGRRRLPQDLCKNVKEALVWEGPDSPIGKAGNKKRSMVQQNRILKEHSPEKWKTMYRDQYRKFTQSPTKHDAQGIDEQEQAAPNMHEEPQ